MPHLANVWGLRDIVKDGRIASSSLAENHPSSPIDRLLFE